MLGLRPLESSTVRVVVVVMVRPVTPPLVRVVGPVVVAEGVMVVRAVLVVVVLVGVQPVVVGPPAVPIPGGGCILTDVQE